MRRAGESGRVPSDHLRPGWWPGRTVAAARTGRWKRTGIATSLSGDVTLPPGSLGRMAATATTVASQQSSAAATRDDGAASPCGHPGSATAC